MLMTIVSLVVSVLVVADFFKRIVTRSVQRAIWVGCRHFADDRSAAKYALIGTFLFWLVVTIIIVTPMVLDLIAVLKR